MLERGTWPTLKAHRVGLLRARRCRRASQGSVLWEEPTAGGCRSAGLQQEHGSVVLVSLVGAENLNSDELSSLWRAAWGLLGFRDCRERDQAWAQL